MDCPQCGARMDEHALKCAYCGYENEAMARKYHEEEIRGVYARLAAALHLPQQALHRWTKVLLMATGVLMAVFLVGLVMSALLGKWGSQTAYRRQQLQLEELETLYQTGEYMALEPALEKMQETYGASYDKYWIISDMAQKLAWEEESCTETVEFLRGYPQGADLLAYDLNTLFVVLNDCDALEAAEYVYDEGEAVEHMRQKADHLLREVLLLSDEEIRAGQALALLEEPDYSQLYLAIVERIGGGES